MSRRVMLDSHKVRTASLRLAHISAICCSLSNYLIFSFK
nr:MAG TPA: hypothetical protein [Caudoviricetes sp.]